MTARWLDDIVNVLIERRRVARAAPLCHSRTQLPDVENNIKARPCFLGETWAQANSANRQLLISMVGAVGIEPTTSPGVKGSTDSKINDLKWILAALATPISGSHVNPSTAVFRDGRSWEVRVAELQITRNYQL